jgi:hypothetical protein
MNNVGRAPVDFTVANVDVTQSINGQDMALHVFTFEELAQEERNRQIARAVLVGLAAGAGAASAASAGYYNQRSVVTTPRGATYQVNTTGYSPTAAAIAQSNVAANNEAMIATTLEQGQRNMAALEQTAIKDNTLLPGEWYGGRLELAAPIGSERKTYTITITLGSERHEIVIEQGAK